ncbi:hypothetical protein JCM10213_005664 [Rhodosporidiobolus nylandii]
MSGNLSHSMRENYGTHGVSEYYKIVQESYRNPHFPPLKKVLAQFMDQYVAQEKPKRIRILDLAAGSGEATISIQDWYDSRWPSAPATSSASASPSPAPSPSPATPAPPAVPGLRIRQPFIPPSAAARAAVARPSRTASSLPKPDLEIIAADPFTAPAYKQRTGRECLELSFQDVAEGKLPSLPAEEGEEGEGAYDIVVISFALHLVESSSELWALLTELAKRARWLVVTAPHKKPDIKSTWSWRRWDPSSAWQPADEYSPAKKVGGEHGDGFEIVLERVRLRLWRSEDLWAAEE